MTQAIKGVVLITLLFVIFSCKKEEVIKTVITTADFSTTINEDPELGAILGTVAGSANIGEVSFTISSQSPSGAMAIDAATGELTVADETLFLFEQNSTITGEVMVSSGDVAETVNVTINLTQIVITIADFDATIDEYPEQGDVLGTITGEASVGDVIFSISSQSQNGALAIDASNGELTVADETLFVYESNASITAEVLVSTGNLSKVANVTITITDVYNLDSDRLALIDLYNFNQNTSLNWDVNNTDISTWEGVTVTNQRVTTLNLNFKKIDEIPDVVLNRLNELTTLYASNNNLSNLDLSNNTKLYRVEIFNNNLTGFFDVSNNVLLEILLVESNKLTGIDLSSCTLLRDFKAHSNNFQTNINIANGNNSNMTRMEVQDNPDLMCIQVDDGATNGFSGWFKDDDLASYSTNCQ